LVVRTLNLDPVVEHSDMNVVCDRVIAVKNSVSDHLVQRFRRAHDWDKPLWAKNLEFAD
jgi:hypothetical protein